MDLKVKMTPNHQTDVINEFLVPKLPKFDYLHMFLRQVVKKLLAEGANLAAILFLAL